MWYFFSRTDCSMVGLPVRLAEETGVAGFDWSLRCKGLQSMWQIRFNIMTLGARLTSPGLVFPTRRLEKSSPGLVKSKAATCDTPARRSVSRLVSFLQQPSRAPVRIRINTCFFPWTLSFIRSSGSLFLFGNQLEMRWMIGNPMLQGTAHSLRKTMNVSRRQSFMPNHVENQTLTNRIWRFEPFFRGTENAYICARGGRKRTYM